MPPLTVFGEKGKEYDRNRENELFLPESFKNGLENFSWLQADRSRRGKKTPGGNLLCQKPLQRGGKAQKIFENTGTYL